MSGTRYVRDREIGRGGMGAVWLGHDQLLGRAVAIKRIGVAPGAASTDGQRAEREARIAANLQHRNIVSVFDFLEEDGEQWLVMEYVEGQTLGQLIKASGGLSEECASDLLAQAADGLAAAHAGGVVHRDVKPSNILVGHDGTVKLTDFGIARGFADPSLTQTGMVTGSPAYLAPEIASGQGATAASDVWSFGATLFHTLSGKAPYETGDNVLGALYKIVNEPAPRLGRASDLDPVLRATMTHEPDERWTMTEVAAALRAGGTKQPPREPFQPTQTLVLTETGFPPAPAARPASPPPIPVASAPAAPPVGPPQAPPATPARPGQSRPLIPVLVALVVLGLVGVLGLMALLGGGEDPDTTANSDSTAAAGSSTPSETSPATSEPTATAYTEDQLRDYIDTYLKTASKDPAAGFTQLTPRFQAESTQYNEFWGSVKGAKLVEFHADVDTLIVTYRWSYSRKGQGKREDPEQLQLVESDGHLLIDGRP